MREDEIDLPDEPVDDSCPLCDGTGMDPQVDYDYDGGRAKPVYVVAICWACHGTGKA